MSDMDLPGAYSVLASSADDPVLQEGPEVVEGCAWAVMTVNDHIAGLSLHERRTDALEQLEAELAVALAGADDIEDDAALEQRIEYALEGSDLTALALRLVRIERPGELSRKRMVPAANPPARPDEPPAETTDDRYVVEFLPQRWVGDMAMEVEPEGPAEWCITRREVVELTGFEPSVLLDRDVAHATDRDNLRESRNAPRWVREWSGPFEVYLSLPPGHEEDAA